MRFLIKTLSVTLACFSVLSQSGSAGNGSIDGTGLVNSNNEPIVYQSTSITGAPQSAAVESFLNALGRTEPTLSRLMKRYTTQSDAGLSFYRLNESCYLPTTDFDAQPVEVFASYFREINWVWLCPKFYKSDSFTQVFVLLHELSHYVLKYVPHTFSGDEEAWVNMLSYQFGDLLKSTNARDFDLRAKNLRSMLDKNLPDLTAFVSPGDVLKTLKPMPILGGEWSSLNVHFPVPGEFFFADYIDPHFLPFVLQRIWESDINFNAVALLKASLPATEEHRVSYICSLPDGNTGTHWRWCESRLERERVVGMQKVTPLFAQFLTRYKALTGRSWLLLHDYVVFFE